MQPVTAPDRKHAVSPARPKPKPPLFASFHSLLMRVDDVRALPEKGMIWARDANGILNEHDVTNLRPEQLAAGVQAGRISLLWGHRYQEFEDLTPEWASSSPKLARHRLRQLRARRVKARINPEDDQA